MVDDDTKIKADVVYDSGARSADEMEKFVEFLEYSEGYVLDKVRRDGTHVIADPRGNLFLLRYDAEQPPNVYALSLEQHKKFSTNKIRLLEHLDLARERCGLGTSEQA